MNVVPEVSASNCERCGSTVASDALVCGSCHALLHGKDLETLSASARAHESRREYALALEDWQNALKLLPPDASQAEWIRTRTGQLALLARQAAQAAARGGWAKRFGPLAPVVLFLAKFKFLLSLLKLKFLLSFAAFASLYWALYGWKFGVGFAALIMVHEFGHFIEIKRRGLPAELPVFLPGVGAYVRWTATGLDARARAMVSLAGPLAGALGALVCAGLWIFTASKFWLGLASLTALINLLNLIPIAILDGGQAMAALDKGERIAICVIAILCAIVYSQPLFLLVTAGAAYRLFTRDLPDSPGRGVTAYYIVLLVSLGFLIQLAPPMAAGGS
jgi:Zn-dependent protease